jgi:hypothetical protein
METTFENARVGDRVWHMKLGWGVVDDIRAASGYPLSVKFDNKKDETFLLDGTCNGFAVEPQSLFWDEVKFDIPTRPKRKVEKQGWILIYKRAADNSEYRTQQWIYRTYLEAKAEQESDEFLIPITWEEKE